jgi:hypothetical protein
MLMDTASDEEIRAADCVVLQDVRRDWHEWVGACRPGLLTADGKPIDQSTNSITIAVDSTDIVSVQKWRERIIAIRNHPAGT